MFYSASFGRLLWGPVSWAVCAVIVSCVLAMWGSAHPPTSTLGDVPGPQMRLSPRPSPRRRPGSPNTNDGADNLAASYSRYSSNLQDDSSLDQQKRKCRERAAHLAHVIPPELEFTDAAVSGKKRDRAGLDALLNAAAQGCFRTLYVDSLSRLAREFVIILLPEHGLVLQQYTTRVVA